MFDNFDPQAVPVSQIPALIAQLASISQALIVRLVAAERTPPAPSDDRLVNIREASERTGLSVDYLYRHADLPFRVRVAPGQVRFSINGIARWSKARSGGR